MSNLIRYIRRYLIFLNMYFKRQFLAVSIFANTPFKLVPLIKKLLAHAELKDCENLSETLFLQFITLITGERIWQNNFKLFEKMNHEILPQKLWFSICYIFAAQYRRPLIFQTLNSVRSNNISLKYQRFTTLGFKDIGIINQSL